MGCLVGIALLCNSESDRKLSLNGDRFVSLVEVIYHHYHLLSFFFFIFIIINCIVISHDLSSFFTFWIDVSAQMLGLGVFVCLACLHICNVCIQWSGQEPPSSRLCVENFISSGL